MKPDEDNASMDSILASIRRIIASEPDPMPESMKEEGSVAKTIDAALESKKHEERGSILELKEIVEKRRAEEETLGVEDVEEASETEVKLTPQPKLSSEIDRSDALGEGFEVFLRSTLERIVVDFLKDWADQNITRLAERILREEIKNTFEHTSMPERRVSQG